MENTKQVTETPELLLKHLTAKSIKTFVEAYFRTMDIEELRALSAGIATPDKETRGVAILEYMLRENLDEAELVYLFTSSDYLTRAFDEGHIGVNPMTMDSVDLMRHRSIVRVVITAYRFTADLGEAGVELPEEATLSDISAAAFLHLATGYLASEDAE